MPTTGSLLAYENNNHIVNTSNKGISNIYSNFATFISNTTVNSMGKIEPPLNSTIAKIDGSVNHKQHQAHLHFNAPHLPSKYMNSKRTRSKYNSMNAQIYSDHNNYLHLNSLWSIWYGVLFTLFQGYLAVHGAYRFLGCSLISWRTEPVAELNLQIILSGLVFVLLPFFFTSAVFKVGNMANDGIKLGSGAKEKFCSMIPHDGLEEESHGGTLRTLWTHGGPTAAFIHIVIAMCLLLPRLLLEGRIIENGILPKETIWQTELDFIFYNRYNSIASIIASSYHNNTPIESSDNYFNDTHMTHFNDGQNITHWLDNNIKQKKDSGLSTDGKTKNFDLSNFVNVYVETNKTINDSNANVTPNHTDIRSEVSYLTYSKTNANKTKLDSKKEYISSTELPADTNDLSTNINEDMGTTTEANFISTFSTQASKEEAQINSTFISFSPSSNVQHNSHKLHQPRESYNDKAIRKHHRQRKIALPLAQRKNHQHDLPHQKAMKSSRRIKDTFLGFSKALNNIGEINFPHANEGFNGRNILKRRPTSHDVLDYGQARVALYSNSSATISTATRDSNIHIVKPEKLPEIIPSTPVSSNSKIIDIKPKANKKIKREILPTNEKSLKIEPKYLVGEVFFNDSSEYISEINSIESSTTLANQSMSEYNVVRLGGFAGMLQLLFGIEKPIDVKLFRNPPSAEFINLVLALLAWCVRYPAVFWTTAKSFAAIFSVQMVTSAADITFSFVGISSLFKLQIYSQGLQIKNRGLILNAAVTLALFLLSVLLILCSSMILYLYGHGRLSAKMRDRSIISLNAKKTWIYFSHCASLCYVIALTVVKAPLLYDLIAVYRNNLDCHIFMAALFSVIHILLWVTIWMGLTVKRKWSFKLPPLDAYSRIGKATTQPLLMQNRGSLKNTAKASINNCNTMDNNISSSSDNAKYKKTCRFSGKLPNNPTSLDVLKDVHPEEVYWTKVTPSSPKLKVTFNEETSTSDNDHHRLIGDHKQNVGKRNSACATSTYFTSIEREIDDGEYATLRSSTENGIENTLGDNMESDNPSSVRILKENVIGHTLEGNMETDSPSSVRILRLSEYDELPLPPLSMISSMAITNHGQIGKANSRNTYVNCPNDRAKKGLWHDTIPEEGKLLASVEDNSMICAPTCNLGPPLPPPPPPPPKAGAIIHGSSMLQKNKEKLTEYIQLSSSPNYLASPLAPVKVAVQTYEAHIAPSSTPRCLRRTDSGIPQEVLTPKSDTNSCGTESTISPPERTRSESSSGIHSGEEREIEVIIRPRVANPFIKLPTSAIQEPNGRCTNMRLSSFVGGCNANSSTLPLQRSNADTKFDYSQHCSTMPLLTNSHNFNEQPTQYATYATSIHCMSQTQSAVNNLSSFKTPLYANSGAAMSSLKPTRSEIPPPQHVTHITLPNGARYSNPNILRRHPFTKTSDSLQQMFTKFGYENSVVNATIQEDRDSANYSMTSD